MIVYCFDCDGVICNTEGTEYANATPKKDNIARINALYDAGNRIIIFTGRGTVSKIDWRGLTEKQFAAWGVKYHELIFHKPNYDFFVDDKNVTLKEFEGGFLIVEDFEAENTLDSLKRRLCRVLDRFIERDYDHEVIRPFRVQNMLQNLSLDYVQKLDKLEAESCINSLTKKS